MAPAEPQPGDALRSIAPDETEHVRWARRNIPGADALGLSASQLSTLCIEYIRKLLNDLDNKEAK